jgi:hopanoid biosynthesis associated protein HpnK
LESCRPPGRGRGKQRQSPIGRDALKRLIVTADDFGIAPEVNEAVETAHQKGILTAASLMVAGPTAADAVARAHRLPRLRVGLHLTLVEGPALLHSKETPDLVDDDGRLRADLARFGLEIALSPAVRRQVRAEIAAQFEAFRATGLPFDHVNAHKHFHLHPVIAQEMLAVAKSYKVEGIRVPVEPARILAAIERAPRRSPAWIMAPWAHRLARNMRRAGFWTPDAVFGLAWSGAMTPARVAGLIRHLPPGCHEIYLHPAIRGGFPFSAPGYRYADEFTALMDPEVLAAARRDDIVLGGYTDFQPTK